MQTHTYGSQQPSLTNPQAPSRKANLLDLPDELLLDIIRFLPEKSLHRFSFTSNRIHHLAYPLYLSPILKRHGAIIGNLSDLSTNGTLVIDNTRAIQDLFRQALWIKVVHFLQASFSYGTPSSPSWLRHCIDDIVALERLLSSLDTVRNIHLSHKAPHVPPSKWCAAVLGVLNVLEGKACEGFTVRASGWKHYMLEVGGPSSGTTSSRLKSIFKSKIQPSHFGLDLIPGTGRHRTEVLAPYPSLRPLATLTSFSLIHSSLLVVPPLLSWTLSTINNSRGLTRVVLTRLALSTHQWSQILPLISIQALSHLTLSSFTLSFTDLSKFLSRHSKTLVMLDLRDGALVLDEHSNIIPRLELPQLGTLHATPEYITELLRPTQPGSTRFPLLREVSINPFLEDFVPRVDDGVVDRSLSSLGQGQAHRELQLTLHILGHSASAAWFQTSSPSHLHCVTGLRFLTWMGQRLTRETAELLPPWLALFPALREVKFAPCVLPFESDMDKIAFARRIKDACPNVAKIPVEKVVISWMDA
jgi:hypothetical protein